MNPTADSHVQILPIFGDDRDVTFLGYEVRVERRIGCYDPPPLGCGSPVYHTVREGMFSPGEHEQALACALAQDLPAYERSAGGTDSWYRL